MKLKTTILFSLLFGLSISSFAHDVAKSEFLNYKETTTGNAKLISNALTSDKHPSVIFQLDKNNISPVEDQIYSLNSLEDIEVGQVGETTIVKGNNGVQIKDNTSTHTYSVQTKLCIVDLTVNVTTEPDCLISIENVGLDYSVTWGRNRQPILWSKIDHAGDYVAYLETTITRDNSDIVYTSGTRKVFTVSDDSLKKRSRS